MSLSKALDKVPAGVPLPWKFHHENWEKPWESQSGDFPPHETEREHELRRRDIKSKLHRPKGVASQLLQEQINRWPWGYTIYRTVFTPESHSHWDTAVDAIQGNIFATLEITLRDGPKENEDAHRILRDGYRTLVFQDKTTLDGASIDQIRQQFKDFVTNEFFPVGVRFRWCLVIDAEAIQSFLRYPQPVEASDLSKPGAIEENGAWVTVVDPEYEPSSTSRGRVRLYQGFVRCHLNRLLSLAWAGSMNHISKMNRRGADGVLWYEEKI